MTSSTSKGQADHVSAPVRLLIVTHRLHNSTHHLPFGTLIIAILCQSDTFVRLDSIFHLLCLHFVLDPGFSFISADNVDLTNQINGDKPLLGIPFLWRYISSQYGLVAKGLLLPSYGCYLKRIWYPLGFLFNFHKYFYCIALKTRFISPQIIQDFSVNFRSALSSFSDFDNLPCL